MSPRHRRPGQNLLVAVLGVATMAALIALFLYSVNQAYQDAPRRVPAETTRTFTPSTYVEPPSNSMHREGSP